MKAPCGSGGHLAPGDPSPVAASHGGLHLDAVTGDVYRGIEDTAQTQTVLRG